MSMFNHIEGECQAKRCTGKAEFGTSTMPLCLYHWREMEWTLVQFHNKGSYIGEHRQRRVKRAEERESECSVYYILRPRDGHIKIGYSKDIPTRMDSLKEGAGKLRLLAREEGGPIKEARRHTQFAHHRVEGEWFRPGDDLKEHIKRLASGVLVA